MESQVETPSIQIKGIRDGLLVSCAAGAWDEIKAALLNQIAERAAFFQGARLALDVGTQTLKVNDLVELRDILSEKGISLWAVISESPTTEQTAQLLGLATRISKPRPQENQYAESSEESALFINRTIRSGTRIEYPGNVVIVGDVNPGAEIIAEGSVIVWGRVRGMIHAGCKGNRSAFICALDLSATQLRIAEETSATLKPQKNPMPEITFIDKEGRLQAERWHDG